MIKKINYFLFCFLLFSNLSQGQFGLAHELGVISGPVFFRSDYGLRNDEENFARNVGTGIGLIHYINFSYKTDCNCYTADTYFNDHFKLRSELSYNKTKLNHFGKWVTSEGLKPGPKRLQAMHGSAELTNLGMQLEYFPFSIRRFSSTLGSWAPYIGLGAQFSYYNAVAESDLGPLGTLATTFPKYLIPSEGRPFGFSTESGTVFSAVINLGIRYKLTIMSDLILDFRSQYFNSNWVDGLNPNPNIFKENKAKDGLNWLSVGYIYYIE